MMIILLLSSSSSMGRRYKSKLWKGYCKKWNWRPLFHRHFLVNWHYYKCQKKIDIGNVTWIIDGSRQKNMVKRFILKNALKIRQMCRCVSKFFAQSSYMRQDEFTLRFNYIEWLYSSKKDLLKLHSNKNVKQLSAAMINHEYVDAKELDEMIDAHLLTMRAMELIVA